MKVMGKFGVFYVCTYVRYAQFWRNDSVVGGVACGSVTYGVLCVGIAYVFFFTASKVG